MIQALVPASACVEMFSDAPESTMHPLEAAAIAGAVPDLVLRADDRAPAEPGLHWDRILFCAKEAVYKAWFPLTRRWLEFADVAVSLDRDGTFRAAVGRERFGGRWAVGHGL